MLKPWQTKVLIALPIIILGGWLASNLTWEPYKQRTGFRGEALTNPYHAGMLLLQRLGLEARRLKSEEVPAEFPENVSVLLDDPRSWQTRDRQEKLIAWVKRGGHLILPAFENDEYQPLQNALGINKQGYYEAPPPSSSKEEQASFILEEQPLHINTDQATLFSTQGEHWQWHSIVSVKPHQTSEFRGISRQAYIPANADEDDETIELALYARAQLGRGWITTGYFEPLKNRQIQTLDHAQLFVRLMSLPETRQPLLIVAPNRGEGLWEWLSQHALEALIASLALLLLWLWSVAPRFGPRLPDFVAARPGLLSHLSAVGNFLVQEQDFENLICALREEVIRGLTQLRGHYPEQASLATLGAHIANTTHARVETALSSHPQDRHDFLQRVRTLALLRQHIRRLRQSLGTLT